MFLKIVAITLLFVFAIGVYGCGRKTPTDAVKNYLEEVKKGSNADISSMLNETLDKEEKKDDSLAKLLANIDPSAFGTESNK